MKKILLLFALLFTSPLFASGIGANATSASCDNETLETYNGTANVEIDWEPNTINIAWYNGDDLLDVQNSAQTCTYDGILNVPSTPPTKTGYTFNGWELKTIFVPDGFTQLEYIRTSGEQRINTGIYANENTAVETKFISHADSSETTTRVIIADSWYNQTYMLSTTAYTRAFQYIGTLEITRTDYWAPNQEYTVYMDKTTGQVVNGVTTNWTGTPNTFTSSIPLTMFGVTDVVERSAFVTMYYLKIWQNGILVRHFVPAKRNSDNVIGLYDAVSKTFFTNVGSGTFVAGPAVN